MKNITCSSIHLHSKENILLDALKLKFKGDEMIGLWSKSHCAELFHTEEDHGEVKFCMIGANKGKFENPMTHYEQVLTSVENFRACNSGICSNDQMMAMYKQYKNALTFFYPKHKVLKDGHSAVPLNIWYFVYSVKRHSLHGLSIH